MGSKPRVAVMGVSPGGRDRRAKPEGPIQIELRVKDSLGWQREFFQEKEPVQGSGGWGSTWVGGWGKQHTGGILGTQPRNPSVPSWLSDTSNILCPSKGRRSQPNCEFV